MGAQDVRLRAGVVPTIGDVPVWGGEGWEVRQLGPRAHDAIFAHTDTRVRIVSGPLQTRNFVTGESGWRIQPDGSAEFNDVVIRGSVVVGPGIGFTLDSALAGWHFDGPDSPADYQVDLVDVVHGYPPITETGSIVGLPAKFGKGANLVQAFTNLEPCPAFQYGTTGWGCGGTNTIAQSSEQSKFGGYSLKCTYQDSGTLAQDPITLTAAAHSLSVWVYIPSDYDGTQVRVRFSGFTGATGTNHADPNMSLTDQWQLVCVPNYTIDAGDLGGYVEVVENGTPAAGKFIYLDGVQCTATAYCVPFRFGDMPGCAWSGTAGQSATTVTAAVLAYDNPLAQTEGEAWVHLVWIPAMDSDASTSSFYLFDEGNFKAYYNGTDDKFYFTDGTNTASTSAQTFSAFDEITLDFVASSDGLAIYVDGVADGTAGTFTEPTWGASFYVGCTTGGANQCNGTIDELAITSSIPTAEDIETLYSSGKPFAVHSSSFSWMLTGPGGGKVWGYSGGLYGQDEDGNACFALVTEDSVSWGGFTVNAGDVILGENAVGSAAMLWDRSTGKLGFYGGGSGTVQVEVDTDGSVKAGAGVVSLNSGGIDVVTTDALSDLRSYKLKYSGATVGRLGAYSASSVDNVTLETLSDEKRSYLWLRSENTVDTNDYDSRIALEARNDDATFGQVNTYLEVCSYSAASPRSHVGVYGGLMVGWLRSTSGAPNPALGELEVKEYACFGKGIYVGGKSEEPSQGAIYFLERSSDPAEPGEGEAVIWMSDGSGKGDDGDVLVASKAGGSTKYAVVFDHSAGAAW